MERLADRDQLSAPEWGHFQDLFGRFFHAWQEQREGPGAVDLQEFLPPDGDPARPVILQELIKADLEFRWKRGQAVDLEYYAETYPELGPLQSLSPALIAEEFRIRQSIGDKPALADYQRRFPDQLPELQHLVEEHGHPGEIPSGVAPPEPPSLPPLHSHPGLDVGHGYTLLHRLGDGGFGEVWRASSPGGIEVAIKIGFRTLDQDESQRELESLELIKQLRHPFLMQTHDFWTYQGRLHIAMELADGSLRDRLKHYRAQGQTGIPVVELIRYFSQVAEALDYLHSRQILHRDIKPDNILLQSSYAKVADFGLARLLGAQHSISVSGSGTPAYMAPEMFGSKVNANTDQYCLAVAYGELRLDRPLFSGHGLMELMMQHVTAQPDLDPLPQSEQAALLRALAKNPDERYLNCRDFVESLELAVAEAHPSVLRRHSSPTIDLSGGEDAPAADASDSPAPSLPESPPEENPTVSDVNQADWTPTNPSAASLPAWAEAPQGEEEVQAPPKRRGRLALMTGLAAVVLAGGAVTVWLASREGEKEIPAPVVKRETVIVPEKKTVPPIKPPDYLADAEKLYDQQNYGQCLQQLARVDPFQPDSASAGKFRVLRSLAEAHGQPQEKARAARQLKEFLKDKNNSYRRLEVCKELQAFARADPPTYLAPALEALGGFLNQLPGPEKSQVEVLYRDLILNTVPRLTRKEDWDKVLTVVRKVAPNGWALGCKAECLLENSSPTSAADWKEAWNAVQDDKTRETGGYAHYLRALVTLRRKGGHDPAAQELRALLSQEQKVLQSPLRRGHTVDACLKIASELRGGRKPALPYTSANATLAFQLLDRAQALTAKSGRHLPTEAAVNLALAAWYKEDPKVALADKLTMALEKAPGLEKLGPDVYPLLLGKAAAQPQTPAGRETQVVCYEKILHLFLQTRVLKVEDEKVSGGPVALYNRILRPALILFAVGNFSDSRAARFYAYQGQMLCDYYPEFKKVSDESAPLDDVLAAYAAAISRDPRAEYFIQHAKTIVAKAREDGKSASSVLTDIEKDVASALEHAKKDHYPQAYLFNAWILETKAGLKEGADRIKLYQDALDALAAYREASKKKDRAPYWLARGRCFFKWAKYGDSAALAKYLPQAIAALDWALRLKPSPLEKTQADYWKACAYQLQKDFAKADARFEAALRGAKNSQAPETGAWQVRATIGKCEADLTWAPLLMDSAEGKPADLINAVWNQVGPLRIKAPSVAARLEGRCLELRGKPAEAYQVYTRALTALEEKNQPLDVPLFLARLELLTGPFKKDLQDHIKRLSLIGQSTRAGKELTADPSLVDPWLKAACYADGALARRDAANLPGNEDKSAGYRRTALKWLKKAIALAPNHPRRKEWEKVRDQLEK